MSKLDQSLDSIIDSESKSSRGGRRGGRGGRGRGRGRGRSDSSSFAEPNNPLSRDDDLDAGPERRESFTRRSRAAPYSREEPERMIDDEADWKHDMYRGNGAEAGRAGAIGGARMEPGSKILISGLDSDVSGDDLKEIFAQVGNVTKAVVHYDQNAKSLGTAEVTFATTAAAAKAVKEYDGAEVDGKPMYVKLVGAVVSIPRVIKKANRDFRSGKDAYFGSSMNDDRDFRPRRGGRGRGAGRAPRARGSGSGRGRGGRGRGGARGEGKPAKAEPTAENLDAELEAYQKARGGANAAVGQPAAGQPAA